MYTFSGLSKISSSACTDTVTPALLRRQYKGGGSSSIDRTSFAAASSVFVFLRPCSCARGRERGKANHRPPLPERTRQPRLSHVRTRPRSTERRSCPSGPCLPSLLLVEPLVRSPAAETSCYPSGTSTIGVYRTQRLCRHTGCPRAQLGEWDGYVGPQRTIDARGCSERSCPAGDPAVPGRRFPYELRRVLRREADDFRYGHDQSIRCVKRGDCRGVFVLSSNPGNWRVCQAHSPIRWSGSLSTATIPYRRLLHHQRRRVEVRREA